jgi:hypothetical protein
MSVQQKTVEHLDSIFCVNNTDASVSDLTKILIFLNNFPYTCTLTECHWVKIEVAESDHNGGFLLISCKYCQFVLTFQHRSTYFRVAPTENI